MSKKNKNSRFNSKASNKSALAMTRRLVALGYDVQKQIENGEIDYSFEYKGMNINIEEEIASLMALLPYRDTVELTAHVVKKLSDDDILKVSDTKYLIGNKCRIINSLSNAESIQYKYLMYNALKIKHRCVAQVLVTLILKLAELLKSEMPEHISCVEKSIMISVLYWAKCTGILAKITEITGTNKYDFEDSLSYEDGLEKYNPKFARVYYEYKTGKIRGKEFSKYLASDGERLPLPFCTEYYSSPEFSWRVVNDAVGNTPLANMGYDDATIKAISTIFQIFYSSMLVNTAEQFKTSLYGLFHCNKIIDSDKLNKQIYNMELDLENAEDKLRLAKTNVKELKVDIRERKVKENTMALEIKRLKEDIDKLTKTGIQDIEPYINKIERLDKTVESLYSQIDVSKRNHIKKEDLIAKLNATVESLKEEVQHKDEIISGLRDKLAESSTNEHGIPIESLINYINKHKVIIQGGDLMHTQLKEMGLKPYKLLGAKEPLTEPSMVRNCDLLVIMTKQQSHAMLNSTEVIADKCDTKTLYFNAKNCKNLCRDIFIALSK